MTNLLDIRDQANALAAHAEKLAEWVQWADLSASKDFREGGAESGRVIAPGELDPQVLQARANLILEQAQTLAAWCKNNG